MLYVLLAHFCYWEMKKWVLCPWSTESSLEQHCGRNFRIDGEIPFASEYKLLQLTLPSLQFRNPQILENIEASPASFGGQT